MSTPPAGDHSHPPAAQSSAGPQVRTAALVAIGDEVLRGEIINSNAAFLADRLFDLGFVLRSQEVVSDEPGDIRGCLSRLCDEVDVLICTGGLGPTSDDRTVDVVAAMGGSDPVVHEPSRQVMERGFAARGFELTPNNLRQVRVPAGSEALSNAVGLAPGFAVALGRAQAFFLPGIPREMKRIFADHVEPRLQKEQLVLGGPLPAVRTFHVFGMGESHIDHRLAGLLDQDPGVALHYRTAVPENHVKLIVRGGEAAENQRRLERLAAEVRARLGGVVYGQDGDTFAGAVGQALLQQRATLALAESCTGGYAGQILTSAPGSSGYFVGGVVAYANAVKEGMLGVRAETLAAHGAVSEACAAEMAEGVRRVCQATLGISVTGIAGASEDWAGEDVPPAAADKPVGLVCFGIAGPAGIRTVTRQFFSGRERIRRAAAYFALDLARRYFE